MEAGGLQISEEIECFFDAVGSRSRVVLGGCDFENDGRRFGQILDGPGDCRPIDGAVAWPEVFIFGAVVVVDMNGADAIAQHGNGLGDTGIDVGMTQVEADAHVEVAHFEQGDQVLGCCGFAQQIFDQEAHAEGARKGAEMLQGGHSIFNAAGRPAVGAFAEVDDEIFERDAFGCFEGALDLIHGIDAARLFGVQDVDGGGAGAAHFSVREHWRMHGEWLERV